MLGPGQTEMTSAGAAPSEVRPGIAAGIGAASALDAGRAPRGRHGGARAPAGHHGPGALPQAVEVAPGVLVLAPTEPPARPGWRPPRRAGGSGGATDPDLPIPRETGPPPDEGTGELGGSPPVGPDWERAGRGRPDLGRYRPVMLFGVMGLAVGLAVAAALGDRSQPTGDPPLLAPSSAAAQVVPAETPPPQEAASVATPSVSATSAQQPDSPEWAEVVGALDRVRSKALVLGDREALAEAVAQGSPAWKADTALLEQLKSQGVRPRSLRTQLIAAVPTQAAGTARDGASGPALDRAGAVRLLVTDRRAPYDLLDEAGAVVGRVEGAGKRRWRVVLVPAANEVGWLVHEVVVQP